MRVSLQDIQNAQSVIQPVIKTTELDLSASASRLLGQNIYFKYENQQYTGSFKLRGAYYRIQVLSDEEKKRGVIACSAGNHAQGVALSAARAGVKAVVVMPESAAMVKVEATKSYGAQVILHGSNMEEAFEEARRLEKAHCYTFIHPYEDEYVIAGQGTVGLEIIRQLPDVDTIVVPIGGGGLISGVASAVKALKPHCRVFGVQSLQARAVAQLFHHQTVESPANRFSTIADGIAIKKPSSLIYDNFISQLVDDVVTVSDDEIAEAMVFLIERAKVVVEGAGGTPLAAVMQKKIPLGKSNCLVLSGGNIDLNIMAKVIEKGLIRKGRLTELEVVVDDLPGTLSQLTQVIANHKANILEVHHDRVSHGLFLRETRIHFVLETSSAEHIQAICQSLGKLNLKITKK